MINIIFSSVWIFLAILGALGMKAAKDEHQKIRYTIITWVCLVIANIHIVAFGVVETLKDQ